MLYAAPLLSRDLQWNARRFAAMIALGVAIPFALGLLGLLYPWVLWAVLIATMFARARMLGPREPTPSREEAAQLSVLFVVLVALIWPVAVRPVVDGDSLIYHLPNAAAWVHHHGVWITTTRYWWYPPASELFAASLYAIAGFAAVGMAGIPPAIVLVLRLGHIAKESHGASMPGILTGCALIATPIAAGQLYSLQNDLLLSALFIESLYAGDRSLLATLSLVKPNGFLYTGLVMAATRRFSFVVFLPLLLWVARDLALLPHALLPIAETRIAHSTIAENAVEALHLLPHVALASGGVIVLFLAAGVACLAVGRGALRWAALGALVLFVTVPFGFQGDANQFADGHALRHALPLAALGAALACTFVPRAALLVAASAAIGWGVSEQWALFANDRMTSDAAAATLLAAAVAGTGLFLRRFREHAPLVALTVAATAACSFALALAQVHPLGYLADAYHSGDESASIFAQIARTAPPRIVAEGLPAGAILASSATTDVQDAGDSPCTQAAASGALLVHAREKTADDCGPALYGDRTFVVSDPAQNPPPDNSKEQAH